MNILKFYDELKRGTFAKGYFEGSCCSIIMARFSRATYVLILFIKYRTYIIFNKPKLKTRSCEYIMQLWFCLLAKCYYSMVKINL